MENLKRLSIFVVGLFTQIYSFAQRVRPELDLMDEDEEMVTTSDNFGVTILVYIVFFVLIVFFIWLKGCINENARKKVYVAKKDIFAYYRVSDYYKDHVPAFDRYEHVDSKLIKKGTTCTEVKKVDVNVCWAKFEGCVFPLIVRKDEIQLM